MAMALDSQPQQCLITSGVCLSAGRSRAMVLDVQP